MMSVPEGGSARFELNDQVVALYAIGLLRPRVPRGTLGVVAAIAPTGRLQVSFDNGRTELVHPDELAHRDCLAPQPAPLYAAAS